MSFLSGILKSIINPATLMQLAMGPAGWASLAIKTIGMAIAQQVIQQIGQKLGLPQGIIDMAQQTFSAASGNPGGGVKSIGEAVAGFAAQAGMSALEQGRMERTANQSADRLVEGFMSGRGKGQTEAEEETGGSWLVAMARALGKVMDAKAQQIKDKSDSISKLAGNDITKDKDGSMSAASTKNQNKLSSETTLLQAYTQEMSMISNAAVNSIKTVGEAQTTIARK